MLRGLGQAGSGCCWGARDQRHQRSFHCQIGSWVQHAPGGPASISTRVGSPWLSYWAAFPQRPRRLCLTPVTLGPADHWGRVAGEGGTGCNRHSLSRCRVFPWSGLTVSHWFRGRNGPCLEREDASLSKEAHSRLAAAGTSCDKYQQYPHFKESQTKREVKPLAPSYDVHEPGPNPRLADIKILTSQTQAQT